MIYYGVGKGNLIERNKSRIKYVNDLISNEIILEKYINEIFKLLENQNKKFLIKQLQLLFHEEICIQHVYDMIEIYTKLSFNQIENLKVSVINNYKLKPNRGFILNMYHQFNITYKN